MVSTLRDLDARGHVKVARREVVGPIPVPAGRWAAVLAVVAGLAHAAVHARLGGPTLEALLGAHASPLLPAHALFASSGLVQVSVLAFALVGLVASQRTVAVYDRIAGLVVLASIVASLALATLGLGELWITASLAAALAVVAGAAYLRVQREVVAGRAPAICALPLSILLGWTGVVALASLDAGITATGSSSLAPSLGLVAIAGAVAVYLGLRFGDGALPGFVAWLVATIAVGDHAPAPVASAALFVGAVAAAAALVIIVATRAANASPATSAGPLRPVVARAPRAQLRRARPASRTRA